MLLKLAVPLVMRQHGLKAFQRGRSHHSKLCAFNIPALVYKPDNTIATVTYGGGVIMLRCFKLFISIFVILTSQKPDDVTHEIHRILPSAKQRRLEIDFFEQKKGIE